MRRALIIWVLLALPLTAQQAGQRIAVGDKVPDFTVTDASGRAWKLSELRKRAKSGVVTLTFWCSFCGSWRNMEARLEKLCRDYKDRAGVFGIDASMTDSPKKVESFLKQKGMTLPVFLDADGKVADVFGVRVTTTTLVIDQEGALRYRGKFDAGGDAYAEEALKAVLAGQPVRTKETSPGG